MAPPAAFWSVGDNATSGSTSSGANGTNDFSLGTVDLKADVMMLGIDKKGQTSASTPAKGTFVFGSGTVDVNSLTLGAQESTTTGNPRPGLWHHEPQRGCRHLEGQHHLGTRS